MKKIFLFPVFTVGSGQEIGYNKIIIYDGQIINGGFL